MNDTALIGTDTIVEAIARAAVFVITLATGLRLTAFSMETAIGAALDAPGDFTLTGPDGVILTRTGGELTDPHRTTTLGDQLRWTHVAGDTWKGVRLNDGATYQVGGWDSGWAATTTIDGQRERVTERVGTRAAAQQAAQAHSDANPVERDPWKV